MAVAGASLGERRQKAVSSKVVLYEHDQILTFLGAGHTGILHALRRLSQGKRLFTWKCRCNARLLVTV